MLIHNQETGGECRLVTDASGTYAAASIPIGRYTISVTRDGFAPQSRTDISLTVGQASRILVTLHPGAVSEQISVTDAPSSVHVTTQQTSGLVDERQVKNLPLNDRSYDQLITLNPATVIVAPAVVPLLNLWPVQNGPELLDGNGHLTGFAEAFSSPNQHIRKDFGHDPFRQQPVLARPAVRGVYDR